MSKTDLSRAERPKRRRREGMETPRAKSSPFRERMPDSAKRHIFIRQTVFFPNRHAPVNTDKFVIEDPAALTEEIKNRALEMGADVVGIAEYIPDLLFEDAEPRDHKCVIVFGKAKTNRFIICSVSIEDRHWNSRHAILCSQFFTKFGIWSIAYIGITRCLKVSSLAG